MEDYSVSQLNFKLTMFTIIGIVLSFYAFVVEYKLEQDKNYTAMCDIHEHVSCSKAFASQYGKGFGLVAPDSIFYLPNSVYGIAHYFVVIVLIWINSIPITKFLLFIILLSNFASVYFAYILYFILSDLCVVCVSIYIVNAVLLLYTISKYAVLRNNELELKYKQK